VQTKQPQNWHHWSHLWRGYILGRPPQVVIHFVSWVIFFLLGSNSCHIKPHHHVHNNITTTKNTTFFPKDQHLNPVPNSTNFNVKLQETINNIHILHRNGWNHNLITTHMYNGECQMDENHNLITAQMCNGECQMDENHNLITAQMCNGQWIIDEFAIWLPQNCAMDHGHIKGFGKLFYKRRSYY
jgi:hypothetical protein